MSLWLAIDTATDSGSVAVGRPGEAPVAEVWFGERRHAGALLPAIETLLGIAKVDLASLGGVVIADGPGSFTGLRIGFATALGLREGVDGLAVRVAPSMLGAAWRVRQCADGGPIAVVYDALREEVFVALYAVRGERIETLLAPRRVRVAALPPCEGARPAVVVAVGSVPLDALNAWAHRAPLGPPLGAPSAAALIELLGVPGATAPVEDLADFEPHYGRLAEAQRRWEAAHGRPLPHSDR